MPSRAHWPMPDGSLALALRATPDACRAPLLLWMSWWHETARIPLTIDDTGVAEAKLAWWSQAVGEAASGQAQHPVLRGLLDAAALGTPLPPWPLWQNQLQHLTAYLHQNRWLDEASLSRHIAGTTALAAEGAAHLLGATSSAEFAAAHAWGVAMRRHHQLGRLGQDARAGWVHVPIDTLQRFDVKAHQLVKPAAGPMPAGWPALLQHLHAQAREATAAARAATRALPWAARQRLRPLAVLGAVLAAQGQAVADAPDVVLHQRLRLTPLARTWAAQRQAWRLWWGA